MTRASFLVSGALMAIALMAGSASGAQPEAAGAASAGEPPEVAIAEVRRAPTTITVQGLALLLSATLYRDFMMQPPGSQGGSPLIAILRVATQGHRPLPDEIQVDRAWVLNGEEVWEPEGLIERDRADPAFRHAHGGDVERPPSACELTAHGGPKWGPGLRVDVVVGLRDGSGHRYLLRQTDVPIVGLGR